MLEGQEYYELSSRDVESEGGGRKKKFLFWKSESNKIKINYIVVLNIPEHCAICYLLFSVIFHRSLFEK